MLSVVRSCNTFMKPHLVKKNVLCLVTSFELDRHQLIRLLSVSYTGGAIHWNDTAFFTKQLQFNEQYILLSINMSTIINHSLRILFSFQSISVKRFCSQVSTMWCGFYLDSYAGLLPTEKKLYRRIWKESDRRLSKKEKRRTWNHYKQIFSTFFTRKKKSILDDSTWNTLPNCWKQSG